MRPRSALRLLLTFAACASACDEHDDEHDDPPVAELVYGSDEADTDDGDGPFDNVAACWAVAARVRCGGHELAAELGCPSIRGYACDLGAYFDCVEDQVRCTGDALDTSRVPICIELLSCA